MAKSIKIAVDAMGGENSPKKIIEGCDIFLKNNKKVKLIIFGDINLIDKNFLKKYSETVSTVNCTEKIFDEDKPSSILRSKKETGTFHPPNGIVNNDAIKPNNVKKIKQTKKISITTGKMLKTKYLIRNSIPLVPLSINLPKAPVFLLK